MADAVDIPVQILLLMQKYTRDVRIVVKEASGATVALKDLERQAKRTGKALDSIKASKITLDVDTSAVGRAENDIQALDNLSPKIDVAVVVDEEQAQSELKSLQAPDLRVMVTADEEQAQSELNSLTAPDLKVETTADLSDVKKELESIKQLAKIQLVFDVAGAGLNVVQNIDNLPIISGAQELDAALKSLQASTGQVIPDAERLINEVFSAGNWGASREEVAGVIGELAKFPELATDLSANATTVFEVMQTTGTGLTESIDAVRALVSNGLAPDVQAAGDLIVTAFQKGGDVAGDAIDTIREYSSQWAQTGVGGAAALDLIIQGLQQGTRDGDKLADAFKELDVRIAAAMEGAGSEFDALQAAGLFDEAQAVAAGEMTGLQFAEAAMQALEDGFAIEQNIFDIFGSQVEDFGIDIFKNLDFAQAAEAIIPPGVATEAAALLNDNLGAAFQNLGRVLETSVIDKLKAAGVDINAFLQKATDKLYTIASLIGDGVAFPDAIAIALDSPELGEQIRTLEALLGNFVIELATAIANVGEALKLDVSGIRSFVADAGARQLAYDLTVNPDDMAHVEFAIEQALRRGVDSGLVGEQVARAGQGLIESGDLEAAQQLLETVEAIPSAYAHFTAVARGSGLIEEVILPLSPEIAADPAAIQAEIDATLAGIGASGGYMQGGLTIDVAPTVDSTALEGLLFGAQSDLGESATNWMDNLLNFAQTEIVPPLSDADAVNLAAGALATGDMATALDAANRAGWPITEEALSLLGDANMKFEEIWGNLNAYTSGLQDAEKDGIAALELLKSEGIDPTIEAQDLLTQGASAYAIGLRDQLEIAKVTWDDYATFVNELEINPPNGITPPGTPGTVPSFAVGTTNAPGGLALLHPNEAVLPPDVNAALNSLLNFYGKGSAGNVSNSTVNNIYLNMTNNNANSAAGIASSDRLSAQLRGFM